MRLDWPKVLCSLAVCLFSVRVMIAAQDQSAPPSEAHIQVFITASHKDGSPVELTASDIGVSVDKKPARITDLRSAKSDPLLFALIVDVSKSEAQKADLIRKAALQLFHDLSVGGNQGFLVLFNEFVAMSQSPIPPARVEVNLNGVKFGGGTALYDAIEQTCSQKLGRLGSPSNSRRVIILISDGEDNASHVDHTKAELAAEKEGVAVFSLITQSALAGPRGEHFLREISSDTGGRAVISKGLLDNVPILLAAINEQSALSLMPLQSPNQKMHALQVKSTNKDVEISAPAHVFLP